MRPLPEGASFLVGPRGVETRIMAHVSRIAAVVCPALVLLAWALRGTDGLLSALVGVGLALGNLWLSAFLYERAARVGVNALYAAALFGFMGRLGILTLAFLGLKRFAFVDVLTLGLVLVTTHLGLLVVEALLVSAGERAARAVGTDTGPDAGTERNAA